MNQKLEGESMKSLLLISVMSLMSLAQAQYQRPEALEREAYRVADEIRREAPYLSSQDQAEISRKLQEIREIIRGGGQSSGQYVCVSRDNDGQNPWVIGVREGVTVTRITQAQYSTKTGCEGALSAARDIRGSLLICTSRDNDGQNPYQIGLLQGKSLIKVVSSIVSTQSECSEMVRSIRVQGRLATFCGSRDNDGRSPYVAVALDLSTGQVTKGSESFSSIQQCRQFIEN